MNRKEVQKVYIAFVLYSLSLVLLSCSLTLFATKLYGERKLQFISYKDLEPFLKGQPELAKRLIAISKAILPTVVNVTSMKIGYEEDTIWDLFFRIPRYYQSTGSGFVIDEEGHIVTNYHVVGGAKELYVSFINRKRVKAVLVGGDPKTDIALLKIQDSRDLRALQRAGILQPAPLGTAEDLQVGELVLAVGNPFALNHSVTFGIVSAVGRSHVGIAAYENFIQTDAAINPGNSGGPLVSVRTGKVIGINTAILSKSGGFQGIAFTIPIDMAKRVIEDLKKKGHVERGYIGVSLSDVTEEVAAMLGAKHTEGALIRRIQPKSPADKAGLKIGDIVVECNGKKIRSAKELETLIAMQPIGSQLTLLVDRQGKLLSFSVTVESRDRTFRKRRPIPIGVALREITPTIAERYGIRPYSGLLVEAVREGGLAEQAGLRPGQILLEANRQPLRRLEDFEKALNDFYQGKTLLLKVWDSGELVYLILRP